MGLYSLMMMGGMPIGSLMVGVLAERTSEPAAVDGGSDGAADLRLVDLPAQAGNPADGINPNWVILNNPHFLSEGVPKFFLGNLPQCAGSIGGRSVNRADGAAFDISAVALGLELEARAVRVGPSKAVYLGVVIFDRFP